MSQVFIRDAVINDVPLIYHFINQLAIYEKEPDAVTATEQDIERTLFGEGATAHSVICFDSEAPNAEPIGFAVYFFNYSTWLGRNGLYLEDLYVSEDKRGRGAGKALMQFLARRAIEKDCGRFEWVVLDWNKPAIDFYESIGAQAQGEWIIYRLDGEQLHQFAQ
ncbi:GNAT family N-acetyltransferase [Pseudoalteromonas ruthenica]|uniref:GCN5 family acetyltransferase n=1 Tax=Pseudoalteromonas ruthenica TaxID=151081 RepID=A0A0F4Q3M9_9GAMM|nr:GNAT family N-acetyltransferase [Pseudoalteromonas ruthenica]KJY98201.1 GCN5 family acetyltransferase [Pseudoalteromonas ruthenica]KJZ02268.1 GCN5 family acetyltransferase [Pseudoalteromonas ruthenica]TMO89684.1 N-acetyltransferase [Pseudoalteromonas ruthenica]TMO92109.1 N-acetyltransferase [Pseudoalteromonas ruthenica]TMP01387.1 N-acetyltransferase [Pseudoalteromonas ruthenica]